eukprot:CAMPEP_0196651424 /NCGR_PEP_ID=MMETSP1086-20130531/358_1 /TAXON_ID=77921 /ORGANISM="Cyanoptyche  gloeocystis , Strain SAG4.97" /LENGTH=96 /DNA_ID=CAMNT_0041981407 /DNA_START=118 /DNA_END=408 /DNA_ORIENTATION=+
MPQGPTKGKIEYFLDRVLHIASSTHPDEAENADGAVVRDQEEQQESQSTPSNLCASPRPQSSGRARNWSDFLHPDGTPMNLQECFSARSKKAAGDR